jgi:hypothetical protein
MIKRTAAVSMLNRSAPLVTLGLMALFHAHAAESPFMTLRGKPDFQEALQRYPACFDGQTSGEPGPSITVLDHAPRALIGQALHFAALGAPSPARLGTGRGLASGTSAHGLCVASMLAVAFGAERLEYDLAGFAHEPAEWTADTYFSELTLWRPFFQAYVRHNADTRPGGILPFIGGGAAPDLAGNLRAANALAPSGLPFCPGSPWPACFLLNAESAAGLTDVELQRALSGGALLDGGAVAALQARGAALQVAAAPRGIDIREVFTDDELNVGQVGYVWRPDAAAGETFALKPANEAVRVIGRYEQGDGKMAEAASVLYETQTGGRVAAFGFAGFSAGMSEARRRQLQRAADWVAFNRLPVLLEGPAQAVAVPRVTQAGDLRSVAVLNVSIDTQLPLALRLRGCPAGVTGVAWLTPEGKPVTLAVRWEAKDACVTLPAVGPWRLGWICVPVR